MTGRWSDYFLDEDFSSFWVDCARSPSTRVLLIVGLGFDPRCLTALTTLTKVGLGDRLGYIALQLEARPALGEAGHLTEELARAKAQELQNLEGCRQEALYKVSMQDSDGHNVAGRRTLAEIVKSADVFRAYSDVIVDISGMPRAVFFPLISYLLKLSDQGELANLHVAIAEDTELDERMTGAEYAQADFLHTFGRFREDEKLVWLPVIGAKEEVRLGKIYDRLKASCIEICPIVPFPSPLLRRPDDVLLNHHETLFESFLVARENVVLCDERSPFDIYRKIVDVQAYYKDRLAAVRGVGSVTAVVSPLSTKTLSLGMLLAAVECRLPVCHVEAGTYQVSLDENGSLPSSADLRPIEVWIAGEAYRQ